MEPKLAKLKIKEKPIKKTQRVNVEEKTAKAEKRMKEAEDEYKQAEEEARKADNADSKEGAKDLKTQDEMSLAHVFKPRATAFKKMFNSAMGGEVGTKANYGISIKSFNAQAGSTVTINPSK